MEEMEDVASRFHFYKSMETHLEECFGPVEDFFRQPSQSIVNILLKNKNFLVSNLFIYLFISTQENCTVIFSVAVSSVLNKLSERWP